MSSITTTVADVVVAVVVVVVVAVSAVVVVFGASPADSCTHPFRVETSTMLPGATCDRQGLLSVKRGLMIARFIWNCINHTHQTQTVVNQSTKWYTNPGCTFILWRAATEREALQEQLGYHEKEILISL